MSFSHGIFAFQEDCDKEIDFCFTSEYIGGPEKNRGCSEAGKCTSVGVNALFLISQRISLCLASIYWN